MNEQTEKLANVWANRRAEDAELGITYTFSEKALEVFAGKIREEHTKSVIQLCAKTINDNLNDQAQRKRNNFEVIEFTVIVMAMIGWAVWWYTQFH
jgi:hypothetical protein